MQTAFQMSNDASPIPAEQKYHVPSLARALAIVELLAEHPRDWGVTEIADRLKLPKNSVFRILTTLHSAGYLHRDPQRKVYGLTRKLLLLGYAAVDQSNLLEKSREVMRQLCTTTRETVLLGVMTGAQGVVLDQIPSPQAVKVMVEIGHRFPLHTAAPAKAMLAFLPEPELETIVAQIDFVRFTDQTITDADAFRVELARIRQRGYALDRGEEVDEVGCIAAPVLNHRGEPVASVWVTGPRSRLSDGRCEQLRDLVIDGARTISAGLGFAPAAPAAIEVH